MDLLDCTQAAIVKIHNFSLKTKILPAKNTLYCDFAHFLDEMKYSRNKDFIHVWRDSIKESVRQCAQKQQFSKFSFSLKNKDFHPKSFLISLIFELN